MTGTALTVAGVTGLQCKELTVELFNIMNAINEGNKSAWSVARAYAQIVKEELFDEDFETIQDFADFVGVSKATISQYTNAVRFMEAHEIEFDVFTVGSAYQLSKLTDEEFNDFIKWAEAQGIDVSALSVKALANLIKEYLAPVEDDVVEDDAVEEVAEEDCVEAVDREGVILMIINTMKEHNITIEELQERM